MTEKNTENATDNMDAILSLQDLNPEEIRTRAEELGVAVPEDASDAAVVEAVVAKMGEAEEDETQVEHGQLFSLHSRTEAATNVIRQARNRILANKEAGLTTELFLQNREGDSYTRTAPYVRCTVKNIEKVFNVVALLNDGSQDDVFEEIKASPENFNIKLVYLNRRNGNNGNANFVMLYVKRIQKDLVEQTF